MSTGILVPTDTADVAAFGRRAETLGYDSVWANELWGRDVFVTLAQVAEATDDVRLGTAIVNVYGRSPATIAQAATTVDRAAGGRLTLGLGTSTRKTVADLHGTSFDRPARRLHETTELVGAFLRGSGRVSYEGELFSVADFPALGQDLPVYTAALGPATRRATGRTADGWLPHNVPFPRLAEAFETIAAAAREAGRDPDAIRVTPYVPAAVSDDPEDARTVIRGHIAYYVGNGDGYRRAVGTAFPAVEAVAEAWEAGDRSRARALVTDEMVAALGVAGTPETARDQLAALAARDVVDEPLVVVPDGVPQDLKEQTVAALAPDNRA